MKRLWGEKILALKYKRQHVDTIDTYLKVTDYYFTKDELNNFLNVFVNNPAEH